MHTIIHELMICITNQDLRIFFTIFLPQNYSTLQKQGREVGRHGTAEKLGSMQRHD